jgi:hypothetical protein
MSCKQRSITPLDRVSTRARSASSANKVRYRRTGVDARQLGKSKSIRLVCLAHPKRARIVAKVIIAIGQTESRLIEHKNAAALVFFVRSHRNGKWRRDSIKRHLCQQGRQLRTITQRIDLRPERRQRSQSALLDRRQVHAARVVLRGQPLTRRVEAVRLAHGFD